MRNTNVKELTNQRRSIYIALEGLDYTWDEDDIQDFRKMWEMGIPLSIIAKSFNRDPDEVVLLIMDQNRKGLIQPRAGGIYGRSAAHG